MTSKKFILVGTQIEPARDLLAWARWFETADRHIGDEQIGACRVSTIFLGIDHSFGGGPPVLFETMVFTDDSGAESWSERCCTHAEALEMHARGCEFARAHKATADAAINRATGA